MKPVIGITANFKTINERLNCTLDYDYVSAVNRAGGIGLILPAIQDLYSMLIISIRHFHKYVFQITIQLSKSYNRYILLYQTF